MKRNSLLLKVLEKKAAEVRLHESADIEINANADEAPAERLEMATFFRGEVVEL